MMKRENKLINNGYSFHGYEYDYDAQHERNKLINRGYDVKLKREKSDTRGLKMYSLWIKGEKV